MYLAIGRLHKGLWWQVWRWDREGGQECCGLRVPGQNRKARVPERLVSFSQVQVHPHFSSSWSHSLIITLCNLLLHRQNFKISCQSELTVSFSTEIISVCCTLERWLHSEMSSEGCQGLLQQPLSLCLEFGLSALFLADLSEPLEQQVYLELLAWRKQTPVFSAGCC